MITSYLAGGSVKCGYSVAPFCVILASVFELHHRPFASLKRPHSSAECALSVFMNHVQLTGLVEKTYPPLGKTFHICDE